ncbi:MAG: TonB-dependent receptor [Verrucomicrobia bacterium]|nr:TonB-dependent receptor [Verrucomicrobiota bacterium]
MRRACFPFLIRLAFWALCFSTGSLNLRAADAASPPDKKEGDIFDISLQDLAKLSVVGASKREQLVTQAPSSVTIVTADEVKKYGYRNLTDLLQSARGLHVSYDRNHYFLGTRGFNRGDFNSRVLVLVDGHRVNNNLSDGGSIGTEFILDADLIDRVEIIRGAGSVLYGNNAFFGVINVITKRGGNLGTAEVSGEAASFDTYKGRITYGNKFKNEVELLLSGSLYDSDGQERLFFKEFNSPATHFGIAERADREDYQSFFGNLSWRDFTLQGAFISRDKTDPTAPFDTAFNDPRTHAIDERSYVNLKYEHKFPDVVDVTALAYYDRYDFDGSYLYDVPTTQINREVQAGEWWGTELQLSREFFEKLRLTLGGEYRDDSRQERRNFYEDAPANLLASVQRDTSSHGVYLQGDLEMLKNLRLNAGARYDQYGKQDPAYNPRVALIYNPFENSTIKAIYGTAFRAPNFFELIDPRNQDIQPETITSYELVYEQQITKQLQSTAAAFYNQIDDLITFQGGRFQNLSGAEAKGIELGLDGLWESGLRGRVSYTLQETEDTASGKRLTDSPEHLGKFNLSVPIWKDKVFGSVEFQYTSKRTTWAGTEASGFGIVNLTLFSQRVVKGLEFSASVYNLLDKDYGDAATPLHRQDIIPRDGRTFRAKLTYRF